MNHDEATLDKITAEIEYGNLMVTIVNKKDRRDSLAAGRKT